MDSFWDQFNQSLDNVVGRLGEWLNLIIVNIPNIILAAIVLVIGIYLTRRMRKYFNNLFARISANAAVTNLLANIATAGFFLIILFLVLSILNLNTVLTTILAGAGVAGLAVGLALQEPIINLFAGVMMSARKFFELNDMVETNGFVGIVQRISLRSTILRTLQGQEIIIPNKDVYQSPLKNYTTTGERRVDLSCGVSYGDDLEKARSIAIEAVKNNVEYQEDRPIELFYTEFGDSSINFTLRFWLDMWRQKDYLKAQSDAIMAIKKAFDENDITIPFPIRTLDFGIKGGESLQQMLADNQNGQSEKKETTS